MSKVRILLADNHAAMLGKVIELLTPEYDVVGAVGDGQALLEAASSADPDVLILDISMPVLSGIEVAGRLKKTGSKAKVIFLTVHEDPDFVRASFAAGASGYVVKPRMITDLPEAIRAAIKGRRFVSPPAALKDFM